jgi:dTDP-4-amino-4,6-dideoxygalactose transaminase
MKLPAWPKYDVDEVQAAMAVLDSGKVNYWTGEQGRLFEKEFAEYCGTQYAVAVANGSVGLDVALHALGIGPGDEVIVPCRSFYASAGAIALSGATPIFADIDRRSQNITAATIEPLITSRTKAIICVHLYGWPCSMPEINNLAKKNNLVIVEDCAQAHGAQIENKKIGSWGDVGVFSFCQDKIMTTGGEGGMIVTSNERLWEKAWSYKDHGKSYSKTFSENHPPGFRWLHDSFGSNYRLTEMQSAIGRLQLKKLDGWVKLRRGNAKVLDDALADLDCVRIEKPPSSVLHSYYKYGFFLRLEQLKKGWDRLKILNEIAAAGVPAFTGSCPEIYLEEAFSSAGFKPAQRLPNSIELGETSMQLLVHPMIQDDQMRDIAAIVRQVLSRATD